MYKTKEVRQQKSTKSIKHQKSSKSNEVKPTKKFKNAKELINLKEVKNTKEVKTRMLVFLPPHSGGSPPPPSSSFLVSWNRYQDRATDSQNAEHPWTAEVEFVHAVSAGGSVKFLPAL